MYKRQVRQIEGAEEDSSAGYDTAASHDGDAPGGNESLPTDVDLTIPSGSEPQRTLTGENLSYENAPMDYDIEINPENLTWDDELEPLVNPDVPLGPSPSHRGLQTPSSRREDTAPSFRGGKSSSKSLQRPGGLQDSPHFMASSTPTGPPSGSHKTLGDAYREHQQAKAAKQLQMSQESPIKSPVRYYYSPQNTSGRQKTPSKTEKSADPEKGEKSKIKGGNKQAGTRGAEATPRTTRARVQNEPGKKEEIEAAWQQAGGGAVPKRSRVLTRGEWLTAEQEAAAKIAEQFTKEAKRHLVEQQKKKKKGKGPGKDEGLLNYLVEKWEKELNCCGE